MTGRATDDGGEVLSRALAAACRDPEVLARLGGSLGELARAAHRELAARGPARAMRAVRARWIRAARTPIPAGLRGVDPGWVEAGLDALPARARGAVAAGGGDAIDVWLARWATATIPPMPAISASRVAMPGDAARVEPAVLVAWLEDAGADQLALALGAAGGEALAGAVRAVGDRLTAAIARIARPPRAGALGTTRAAIARCRGDLDDRALVRIGARAAARHIDPLVRAQIAHRLPRALGTLVAAALAAAADTAPADAPRWDALVDHGR